MIVYKLYEKNEIAFSIGWIVFYLLVHSLADDLSAGLGMSKLVTAPAGLILSVVLYGFLRKNGLTEVYGLCPFRGNPRDYLYFLPFVLILSVNLWNGAAMNGSAAEAVMFVISMLCVGFLEEVIFRGLLFRALVKSDGIRTAVVVSSITFGVGHIVNLFHGGALIPTLLQVCYAIAIGFLFTAIFWRGKSLIPCIVVHGIFNSLSFFHCSSGFDPTGVLSSAALCLICIGYALWILRRTSPASHLEP